MRHPTQASLDHLPLRCASPFGKLRRGRLPFGYDVAVGAGMQRAICYLSCYHDLRVSPVPAVGDVSQTLGSARSKNQRVVLSMAFVTAVS